MTAIDAPLAPMQVSGVEMFAARPDLVIDHAATNRIRTAILDRTVELPKKVRNPHENRGQWDERSLVHYTSFLGNIIEVDRVHGGHVSRASRINFGPSRTIYKNVMGTDDEQSAIDRVNTLAGLESRHKPSGRSISRAIKEGKDFAMRLGHRPKQADFDQAHGDGEFLGRGFLDHNFGSMSNYLELIGFIQPKGSLVDADGYVRWGVAVKMQVGKDMVFDLPTVRYLDSEGKGPAQNGIYRHFDGGIDDFDSQVDAQYDIIEKQIKDEQKTQLGIAKELRSTNEVFEEFSDLMDNTALLQFSGLYRLIKDHAPEDLTDREAATIASSQDMYSAIDWIQSLRPGLTLKKIAARAKEMGVHDSIWGPRFSGIDLKVPNPKRRVLTPPEFETNETPIDPESAFDDRTAVREASRLRRLSRLAGITKPPEAQRDPVDFVRQADKMTLQEIGDMQVIIRRGQRKAKRLQLFGPSLDPTEIASIKLHVATGERAQEKFINTNIGLVKSIVYRYHAGWVTREAYNEILHAGTEGLIKATDKFNHEMGFAFSTYAAWWIRYHASEASRELRARIQLSRSDEAAARMSEHISQKKRQELATIVSASSLDSVLPGSEDGALHDILATDHDPTADQVIAKLEGAELPAKWLDDDELTAYELRSRKNHRRLSYQEIADMMGLDQETVMDLVWSADRKIRAYTDTSQGDYKPRVA